ncbi:hypothetical protein BDZ91DRAFT_448204 [Kalaharituber pfeilii]|nr:hypothetical protein BDZ91DRAFT_448204 [Kalaharituber pfeilii]
MHALLIPFSWDVLILISYPTFVYIPYNKPWYREKNSPDRLVETKRYSDTKLYNDEKNDNKKVSIRKKIRSGHVLIMSEISNAIAEDKSPTRLRPPS